MFFASFTELILTREHVENGIRSGKIQVATSSNVVKKPYNGKRESNVVYIQKGRNKSDGNQSVGGNTDLQSCTSATITK